MHCCFSKVLQHLASFPSIRIALTFSYGLSKDYPNLGKGIFHITPLMWTNAVNALGYLSLSGKVKEKFCWDMIEDNYDEAVHVPIKAGIIIMLLIMRSDTIPYTYEHTKQSKMAAAFYSLGKSSLFYKKYNKLTKLLQQQQFNQIHFQCNDCTPGFTDYIILVDFSNNIQVRYFKLQIVDCFINCLTSFEVFPIIAPLP